MSVAGRTTTGKVWHVAVPVNRAGPWLPLCGVDAYVNDPIDLATVPAYRLCQKCERASEQIAAAIRVVQS